MADKNYAVATDTELLTITYDPVEAMHLAFDELDKRALCNHIVITAETCIDQYFFSYLITVTEKELSLE